MSGLALWISEWIKKPAALAVRAWVLISVVLFSGSYGMMPRVREIRGRYPVSADDFAGVDIETNEVACCHESKMAAERIHPYVL